MAITTNKVLRLTFTTAGSKTYSINIPDPREDLQKAEAEAIMDTIVQKNIFPPTLPAGNFLLRCGRGEMGERSNRMVSRTVRMIGPRE
ncbi:DUF2922 domain-containing protein [Desulfitobacterium sp. AusDCA]|uniref:DUF2922 domain-containing protein n=1 Tax=Desulfitobacterium sp. AusDCA TaxID=3240383 RepID=UPI003DA718EF